MSRKAIVIGLAALVALALAPASASAANLTEERATVLASKLGRQVAKERDVRFWRIQRLVKRRTNRFVFEYFERQRGESNRFCKASIVVEQTGKRRRATMRGSRCGTVRAEVLAVEDAVGDALAAVEPRTPDFRRSVDAYESGLEDCVELEFPRRYRDGVDDLFELGFERSLYDPVTGELASFADRLASSGVTDRVLARGVRSWRKYLEVLADVPAGVRDICPPLRQWARDDYSEASKPADFARASALLRSLARHGRRMLAAGERLYFLGVSERTYTSFTPYALVINAAVEFDE